jgi:hypothetical protein
MKKLIVVLMLLTVFSFLAEAQNVEKARLFKTYSTFVATNDDTTGWMNIPEVNGVIASEWVIIGIATDSIMTVVNVLGRNSQFKSGTTYLLTDVYVDSISVFGAGAGTAWSATAPKTGVIMLKDATVNRLEGCDQFAVGNVFNAAANGTTAGRSYKLYLWYQK